MPERIQQRRTRGWRKPENTIGVARPSRFGNPFRVDRGTVYGEDWFSLRSTPIGVRRPTPDVWALYSSHAPAAGAVKAAVEKFRTYMEVTRRDSPAEFEAWIAPLRGKNLMCFCPPGQPCHADVLLELANPPALCPECRDGKCGNCVDQTLDDNDQWVPCRCPNHREAIE